MCYRITIIAFKQNFLARKKKLGLLIFLFLGNGLIAQSQQPPPYDRHKLYAPKALRFDLAILRDALMKAHPGLYWYQDSATLENRYHLAMEKITAQMTEAEFYDLVTVFVASIRCGHTDTDRSDAFYADHLHKAIVFPFDVRIINGRFFILNNCSGDNGVARGSEVLAINGLSADSLLKRLLPHQWTDGYISSYNRIEHFFPAMLLEILDYPERYDLLLRLPDGQTRTVFVPALLLTSVDRCRAEWQHDQGKPTLQFVDSLNTAVLTIPVFSGNYRSFLEKSFQTMKENGTENLVIDLRGNSGGVGDYCIDLYAYIADKPFRFDDRLELCIQNPSDTVFRYGRFPVGRAQFRLFHRLYLKRNSSGTYDLRRGLFRGTTFNTIPPKKHAFKGRVFVLTDIKSYSASAEFAAVAHYNKRVTCIGRETGGAYNGNTSGWEFLLTLPNSGLQITIPIIRTYLAVQGPVGHGVTPHEPIPERIDDIVTHRDTDLIYTLARIRRERTK